MRTIHAEPLDDGPFAPFGRTLRVPPTGTAVPTIAREAVTLYGDLARIGAAGGEIEFGLAVLDPREPRMDRMERHAKTAELLFATRGDFVLPLAPLADAPEAARVRCFVVREGQGCVLDPAVWHWAPFPMRGRCEVLVGFRARTPAEDMTIVPLEAGASVEIAWDA